jgi:hypothetical protein
MAAAAIKPKKIAANHEPPSSRDAGSSLLLVIGIAFAGTVLAAFACHPSCRETRRRGCRRAESDEHPPNVCDLCSALPQPFREFED